MGLLSSKKTTIDVNPVVNVGVESDPIVNVTSVVDTAPLGAAGEAIAVTAQEFLTGVKRDTGKAVQTYLVNGAVIGAAALMAYAVLRA